MRLQLTAFFLFLSSTLFPASNPLVCDLEVGEACNIVRTTGKRCTVKLLGFKESVAPFWDKSKGAFVDSVVSADIEVEVDGVRATVQAGLFRLPQEANGINVLPSVTRNWVGGTVPDKLEKDVRLEIKDTEIAWYEAARFTYPIPDYRWRAMNYQHTWLGICVHQGALYYHRGEDMGMIPDRGAAVAISDATVSINPAPNGDGRSNAFAIVDATGLTFRYGHMNAPNIRVDLRPGSPVRKGEKLGLTGETWNGKPQQVDPHLHLAVYDREKRLRNSYPLIVAAYQNTWPEEPLAVAGGWRHLWAGDEIELDATLSIPGRGRSIVSYEWTFTDGVRAKGAKVSRRYSSPGVYSEQLTVVDSKGHTAIDFVEVYVYDRGATQAPPNGWVNYYPIRSIRPGDEVEFLTKVRDMKDAVIDFGDGTSIPVRKRASHSYARPGTYVITLRGEDAGSGPGIFRMPLVVE